MLDLPLCTVRAIRERLPILFVEATEKLHGFRPQMLPLQPPVAVKA
jgi:hypothetical protein